MTDANRVGLDLGFIRSRIGIFKIATWILSLVVLIILSASQYWSRPGSGALVFAHFVATFVVISQLISIIIYLLKLYNLPLIKRLPWKLMEVGYALLCAVFYFIAMAILGWGAENEKLYVGDVEGGFIAGAIFSAVLLVGFVLFAFFTFRSDSIRSQPDGSSGPSNVST
ncbi:plasmolipin-like [Styela clava]